MKPIIEPDLPPRNTPAYRRIMKVEPVPNTRASYYCTLECGHVVMTFGDLKHTEGRVLCTECRKAAAAGQA
jgi:hypothetical protein